MRDNIVFRTRGMPGLVWYFHFITMYLDNNYTKQMD